MNNYSCYKRPRTDRQTNFFSILRELILREKPCTLADARVLVDSALATASHAVRTNVSQTTGYSPGALAFHRDMLLDVPIVADLLAIRERRQLSVDANLRRANAKRSSYDYQPGQEVLKKRHEYTKLGERWDGPYAIQRVHEELVQGLSCVLEGGSWRGIGGYAMQER